MAEAGASPLKTFTRVPLAAFCSAAQGSAFAFSEWKTANWPEPSSGAVKPLSSSSGGLQLLVGRDVGVGLRHFLGRLR